MKYGKLNLGQVEAVVNKLGGMEGVQRFLRDEITISKPTRSWREKDGVIHFSVTSDGTTGGEWIKRLEGKDFHLSDCSKQLLRSSDFKPTDSITTEVAVLKGAFFKDKDRITKKIRAEADNRGFIKLNAEVACLVREKFTDKEIKTMGFDWLITMHKPIKDSVSVLGLLGTGWDGGESCLGAYYGGPGSLWGRGSGFVFLVAQVSFED
ncbi:MAG: hypothetical protein KAS02_02950 [Candidatus Pacebacteria bacterium]|nr:hypothetical protein [Candidatus Paceibacterota bacterium]